MRNRHCCDSVSVGKYSLFFYFLSFIAHYLITNV
jgi:hypothetical protein